MTESETGGVVSGIGLEMAIESQVTVVPVLRVNLAVQHMLAAARFSRAVGELEAEGKPDSQESIFHNAVAFVLSTVASLEAYANELFFDRKTVFQGYSEELLDNLWETYERKPMLDKFDFALLLMRRPKLNRGALPFQHVDDLVELRNALTHFKPEWENEAVSQKKLSNRLHGKIKGGSFYQKDEFLFPRRWASHSCTKWVVNSALDFAKEFERLSGLAGKYNSDPAALTP